LHRGLTVVRPEPAGRPEHADLARYRDQYMSKHVKYAPGVD
jgi:hypothetical protein